MSEIERTTNTPVPIYYGNVQEFGVGAFVPPGGVEATMVIFHMKYVLPVLGPVEVGLRLKTKDAAEKLITMLREMTDEVWPPT